VDAHVALAPELSDHDMLQRLRDRALGAVSVEPTRIATGYGGLTDIAYRGSAHAPPSAAALPIQRRCARCNADDEQVQRQIDSGAAPIVEAPAEAVVVQRQRTDEELDDTLPEASMLAQRACKTCDEAADQVQPKTAADTLEVSSPDDRFEREADRVAELVTADPAPADAGAVAGAPGQQTSGPAPQWVARRVIVQRDTPGEEAADENEPDLETKELGDVPSTDDTPAPPDDQDKDEEIQCQRPPSHAPRVPAGEPITAVLQRSRGGGQMLPEAARRHMEGRFGLDFTAVRVHTGGDAASMNARLGALAFTSGRDIYFAPGQYRPGSRDGDRLLAHELTHVVQQSGGAPAAPAAPVVQTKVPGRVVHAEVQNRLIKANDPLMVEVPIPGATRYSSDKLTKVGFADLWTSSASLAPDARARKKKGVTEFVPLTAKQRSSLKPATRVTWSPHRTAGGWAGTFPTTFQVADLKPLSWDLFGGGLIQIAHYQAGLAKFAAAFNTANPKSGTIPTGSELTTLSIPPALDYERFETEADSAGPGAYVVGLERLWIYNSGKGIVVYFFLDKNYKSHQQADLKRSHDDLIKVEDLKKSLLAPGNQIDKTNVAATKRRPEISAVQPGALRRAARARRVPVQRQPSSKVDWNERAQTWEAARSTWGKSARGWMRGPGKAHVHKMKIDGKLGIHKPPPGQLTGDQAKEFKTIRFWSSPLGWLAGKVRFALGRAFDFVVEKFEKIKKRFQGWFNKASQHADAGYSFGWRKTLIKLIFKAIKFGMKKFLIESFGIFADCATALMDKAVTSVADELKETFKDEICFLQKAWDDFKSQLESTFEAVFGMKYDQVIKTLADAQEWLNLMLTLEGLIRLGFQAVSCLSPPAFGCLWGLAGQVMLDVALDLIIGTQWFQDHIMGSADVRKVIKRFLGREYQTVIDKVVGAVGLTKFAQGVGPCQIAAELDESEYMEGGGLSGSDLAAQRAAWQSKYGPVMMAQLRSLFRNAKGAPATDQDLQDLLAAVDKAQKNGMSFDDIRKVIEAGRPSAGKAVSLPHAIGGLTGVGSMPDPPAASPPSGQPTTPPTGAQAPGGTTPTPATTDQTGGGKQGTTASPGTGGDGVPVYDARTLPAQTGLGGADGEISARFKGHHTADAYLVVEVGADLFTKADHKMFAAVEHVRVTTPRRTYFPDEGNEKTATHIKIHYKLVDGFMVPPPHQDNGFSAGRIVWTYAVYRAPSGK
jgi:hypothetical protein